MKSVAKILAVLSIPLLFFCAIQQSGRHRELVAGISRLQKAQQERVDLNRRLLTGISVLSGRERIGSVAQNDLGLIKVAPEKIIRVEIRAGTESIDG